MGHMPYSHFAVYNVMGALLGGCCSPMRAICSAVCLSCWKT
ncbi:Uncharacterised protein [Serratia plymuthica]|nr:Uncharacterised protein [Serratia plymuthica]